VLVVDALGRLLRVVPMRALMAILRREHIEDVLSLLIYHRPSCTVNPVRKA
jgi:hypothetical protein